MKIIRSLLMASALLLPLASVALTQPAQAATTSAHAATAPAVANVPADCANTIDRPTRWTVNADGISIKYSPNGAKHYSIAKTATFNADTADGMTYVTCFDYAGGQYWIYGTDQAHPSETGWIGCHYLNVLDSTETCPQFIASIS
jgi:hypothetical protein